MPVKKKLAARVILIDTNKPDCGGYSDNKLKKGNNSAAVKTIDIKCNIQVKLWLYWKYQVKGFS